MTTKEDIFLDLLDKWHSSEEELIWERATGIGQCIEELEKEKDIIINRWNNLDLIDPVIDPTEGTELEDNWQ